MVALKDICISISDGDHNAPPKTESKDSVPFVTISDMQPDYGTFDFGKASRVPIDYYESLADIRKPRPGDIVYSVVGSFGIPILVKTAEPFVFQRHIAILRPNRDWILPEYLYYLMASRQFYAWADSAALGAAQRTITLNSLRNKDIALPALEKQAEIVSAVQPLDHLIENNRKQIKLLEEAAQRLYKEWFVDLRFPGHEDTEIDPETGLPEGWERKRLGELADYISRGVAPKYADESDWHVLGQTCIRNNLVLLENSRKLAPINDLNKVIRFGDVLINSTGVGSLGRTAQVWFNPENITVDSHVTIVRDTSALYSFYLGLWAFSNEQLIESLHTGSTGQTELPKDRLASIRLLKPPSNILLKLNAIVKPLVAEILAKQNLIASLSEARNRLLPRLMEGEIEL